MRKRLSFVFICLASILIVLQLTVSLIPFLSEQNETNVIHSVSHHTVPVPLPANSIPPLDFQRLAEDMASERY